MKILFPLLLTVTLLYGFAIRIFDLNYHSPFIDEAIYIILGKRLLNFEFAELAQSTSWVGGNPFFYPLFTSLFYEMGGILGSRLLNVLLGTVAVYLTYLFTKNLYLRASKEYMSIAALIAGGIMATSAIPVYLSRIAIYDILGFVIFISGLVVLEKAIFEGDKRWYVISAVLFFLSLLDKYIVFMFFPILLAITIFLALRTREEEPVWGIMGYFWFPLLFLTGLYGYFNFESLREFLTGQAVKSGPLTEIFVIFWEYSLFPFLLSMGGLVIAVKRKSPLVAGALAAGFFLPLIVHLAGRDNLAMQQHTVYSLFFIAPAIGFLFAELVSRSKLIGSAVVIAVLFLNFFVSLPKIRALESSWPNTTAAVEVLQSQADSSHRILAEASDIVALSLWEKVPFENIDGPFVFSYGELEGTSAYMQAVSDNYFTFIQLDGSSFSEEDRLAIEGAMGERYTLVFDDGTVKVWRLNT